MAAISTWSTTAASNNSAAPDGAPEGWAPSAVNAVVRENMAQIRSFYDTMEWREWGHTISYGSATTFTTDSGDGDTTGVYTVGRRIKANGATTGTIYGRTTASSHSTITTVTVAWDSGSLQSEALTIWVGPDPTNQPLATGLEPREYADLTNGGANDLTEYEFSETLLDGYSYRLVLRDYSEDGADGHPVYQMQNDASSWLVSNGDYYNSAQTAGQTGFASGADIGHNPMDYSSFAGAAAASFFNADTWIYGAMDTSVRTQLMSASTLSAAASLFVCQSACILNAVDGHNKIRIRSNGAVNSFDSGEAFLYRLREVF